MKRWNTLIVSVILVVGVSLSGEHSLAEPPQGGQEVVAAEKVAEFIHAIIEADRTIYTTHVVQRMQEQNIVEAEEAWKRENALPLPAQLLALSGLHVKSNKLGLEHRLISLWPIYEKNRPHSRFEQEGLEAVTANPNKPYTEIIKKNGMRIFQALYADKAIAPSCISCHNNHPLSPKQNYKLNDVMGGLMISFPLS